MDLLRVALTTSPALMSLDYTEEADAIFLSVDASLKG